MTIDPDAVAHLRHELRTPLNHIIGYSEMLLEEVESRRPGLVPALRTMREAAHAVLDLITDYLAPARVASGAIGLGRLPEEFAVPVERIIVQAESLRKAADAAGDAGLAGDLRRIALAGEQLRALVRHGVTAPPGSPEAHGLRARPGAPPARDPASDPLAGGASGAGREIAAPPVAEPAAFDRGRILVVDDNPDNREVLARRLRRDGHQVETAASGRDALDVLAGAPFDLVLLDVMMPGLDGYEVLRRLKAEDRTRDLPVLMISALNELASVVRCIELGAEDYLPKPFEPVLLRARIGACLEKKRLRDRERRHQEELAEWNRTLEARVQAQVAEMERLGRLKRFFSPQLAELILTGGAEDPLRTHRREITVVFLDLRGFTSFAEAEEPEEVMGVLREYHAEVGRLILAHEGTLERFTGDGMMVFFNDPVPVPNPPERAVRMAVAMRARVAELAEAWRRRGHDLGLGIGIAHGFATLGAIGFEGRWDYAAIGNVTNLAARLCGEAQPGQVLVPQRVVSALGDVIDVEPLGPLTLKGITRPVPAFNIRGVRR